MKLLLDTHVLLWAAGMHRRLPGPARKLLNDSIMSFGSVPPAFGKLPLKPD